MPSTSAAPASGRPSYRQTGREKDFRYRSLLSQCIGLPLTNCCSTSFHPPDPNPTRFRSICIHVRSVLSPNVIGAVACGCEMLAAMNMERFAVSFAGCRLTARDAEGAGAAALFAPSPSSAPYSDLCPVPSKFAAAYYGPPLVSAVLLLLLSLVLHTWTPVYREIEGLHTCLDPFVLCIVRLVHTTAMGLLTAAMLAPPFALVTVRLPEKDQLAYWLPLLGARTPGETPPGMTIQSLQPLLPGLRPTMVLLFQLVQLKGLVQACVRRKKQQREAEAAKEGRDAVWVQELRERRRAKREAKMMKQRTNSGGVGAGAGSGEPSDSAFDADEELEPIYDTCEQFRIFPDRPAPGEASLAPSWRLLRWLVDSYEAQEVMVFIVILVLYAGLWVFFPASATASPMPMLLLPYLPCATAAAAAGWAQLPSVLFSATAPMQQVKLLLLGVLLRFVGISHVGGAPGQHCSDKAAVQDAWKLVQLWPVSSSHTEDMINSPEWVMSSAATFRLPPLLLPFVLFLFPFTTYLVLRMIFFLQRSGYQLAPFYDPKREEEEAWAGLSMEWQPPPSPLARSSATGKMRPPLLRLPSPASSPTKRKSSSGDDESPSGAATAPTNRSTTLQRRLSRGGAWSWSLALIYFAWHVTTGAGLPIPPLRSSAALTSYTTTLEARSPSSSRSGSPVVVVPHLLLGASVTTGLCVLLLGMDILWYSYKRRPDVQDEHDKAKSMEKVKRRIRRRVTGSPSPLRHGSSTASIPTPTSPFTPAPPGTRFGSAPIEIPSALPPLDTSSISQFGPVSLLVTMRLLLVFQTVFDATPMHVWERASGGVLQLFIAVGVLPATVSPEHLIRSRSSTTAAIHTGGQVLGAYTTPRQLLLPLFIAVMLLNRLSAAHFNCPLLFPIRNVMVDGVYDLCHAGHKKAMRCALMQHRVGPHNLQGGNCLFVGVCGDEECLFYKRLPLLSTRERVREVEECNLAAVTVPYHPVSGVTVEELRYYNIHVFFCGEEYDFEEDHYYTVPRHYGVLETSPRTMGISTSDLIQRIRNRKK